MRKLIFLVLFCTLLGLTLLSGCAPVSSWTTYRDARVDQDAIWSGRILIDGSVTVAKNATLTILPGTEIAFVRRDLDQDGLGDATLIIEGRLVAVGLRQEPILFHSAADDPQPGDCLEIRVDFSKNVHLRFCEIRDSAYTLHAHFTRGIVEDCTVRYNIDGCRLGQASFTFRNNLYEYNQGKGINFRNSSVDVHHNIIRYNGSGIFLFESDREFSIHDNNLYGNLENFRLGDFYNKDVSLQGNWWGTADPEQARDTIYDQSRDPEIGRVELTPVPDWVAASGPRDALQLQSAWSYATEGYVDADLIVANDRLYAASWDGRLYALTLDGQQLWSKDLGDTLDATPALTDDLLVLQTWSREVHALDPLTQQIRWRFDYSPSRADDHRQGSPLIIDDLVLVPAWNGTLFALDRITGDRRWSYQSQQPLRARPAWDGERIYLASGAGILSALRADGTLLWERVFEDPLLTEPVITPEGVVVLSRAGELVAFSVAGEPLWRRQLDETCYYGAPLYRDRALYVPTAAGAVWKLQADSGETLWRVATAGPIYAAPLFDNGRIFIGDNSGTLQVLGADSGSLLTRYTLEREIQGRPLISGDQLLLGSRDHSVHSLKLVEQAVP
jgi:outer membrane protein assembly factor BamB